MILGAHKEILEGITVEFLKELRRSSRRIFEGNSREISSEAHEEFPQELFKNIQMNYKGIRGGAPKELPRSSTRRNSWWNSGDYSGRTAEKFPVELQRNFEGIYR